MEEKRRRIVSGSAPVLARLPDISAELSETKTGAQPAPSKGYRFDPPMASSRTRQTPAGERPSPPGSLKSELVYASHSTRPLHPHVFEKSWMQPIQSRLKPRESPILPRSNPFAIPRRSFGEAISPYLQFVTLVALFAAAGTWIQLNGNNRGKNERNEAPATATQHTEPPATKTVDRPIHAPTAIGPVSSVPDAGLRAGRERANNIATLRGDILPIGPSSPATEAATTPNLGPASGTVLPQVQTSDVASATSAGSADQTNRAPEASNRDGQRTEVARRATPGTANELPAR